MFRRPTFDLTFGFGRFRRWDRQKLVVVSRQPTANCSRPSELNYRARNREKKEKQKGQREEEGEKKREKERDRNAG